MWGYSPYRLCEPTSIVISDFTAYYSCMQRLSRAYSCLHFGIFLAVVSPSCFSNPVYSITDLGLLPGGAFSEATWINNLGEVTGYAYVNATDYHAIYWSASTGLKDLGGLGGTAAIGMKINDSGQIAGFATNASGNYRAAQGANPGGLTDLGTWGGPQSVARGINSKGDVAGYAQSPAGYNLAAVWVNGVPQFLGRLSGGFQSYAYDVNNAGHAVGTSESSIGSRTFYFNGTTMIDLGFAGLAYKINDNEQIIGYVDTSSGAPNAVLGTPTGPFQNLGTLGGTQSRAIGINDIGTLVVGDSTPSSGEQHGFVWDFVNGMRDLNSLLDSTAAGWTIKNALSVNNQGQIVGFGEIGGQIHGFVLNPVTSIPEPSTAAGVVIALAAIFTRVKRRN